VSQTRTDNAQAFAQHRRQIQLRFSSPHQSDVDQPPVFFENHQVSLEIVSADRIEHEVNAAALPIPGEALFRPIERLSLSSVAASFC
jgi:hypothetical protein